MFQLTRKTAHVLKEICVKPYILDLIHICYSPAGRSVLGKTVPEVLDTARGRRPRAVLKTEGTVFPNTDRPRLVNNIFIFFVKQNERRAKDPNILGL